MATRTAAKPAATTLPPLEAAGQSPNGGGDLPRGATLEWGGGLTASPSWRWYMVAAFGAWRRVVAAWPDLGPWGLVESRVGCTSCARRTAPPASYGSRDGVPEHGGYNLVGRGECG
jgi:hypothetical protein